MNKIISRAEAKALGIKKYFTGKPCINGHIAERYTAQGRCYACTQTPEHKDLVRKIGHAWRADNPERHKANRDAWALANPDRKRENARAWADANREKEKIRQRKRYEVDPDAWNAATYAWREANPDKFKSSKSNWAKSNRSKMNAWTARYRAAKLQATPAWANHQEIGHIYEEAQQVSEETGIAHHVDHIVPLISDIVCGLHCEANLQILPGAENCSKANRYWPDMP